MKRYKSLLLGAITLIAMSLLASCATHTACYNGSTPVACGVATPDRMDTQAPFGEASPKVIYTPATIYRSWVNRHLSRQQTVVDAHDVYWIGIPGHWNTPIASPVGSGAALLGPSGE